MNKIIYKQKNKILLALLVLGCVVSNVGVVSSAYLSSSPYPTQEIQAQEGPVTGVNNTQPGITRNTSQIRASDTGQNGDGENYPSLPGSSGDIPIAEPTRVQTNTTLTVINPFTGIPLLTSTKLQYSEVIAKIRAQLGQGLIIKLTQNGQVIPSNTPDKLEGEIGYTVQGSIISVIPSSYDELRSKLQGFIHEDFFNLHSASHLRMACRQFHHINIIRVVESVIWPEEVNANEQCLNTDALQSDLIETLKVLCDNINIDNNSKSITTLRRYLAETPTRLQFQFLSSPFPNIILIVISTPPEYDLYNLACLDKDGNLVLKSYSTETSGVDE
jgi:hypothetical protein